MKVKISEVFITIGAEIKSHRNLLSPEVLGVITSLIHLHLRDNEHHYEHHREHHNQHHHQQQL